MKYESTILKRLIDTYGVVGNPRYISEIIKQFIVQGKECYPNLFTYQSDWLAHIDEFGLSSDYVVSYTGQFIYTPNTLEKPVKRAILKGSTKYRDIDTGEVLDAFEDGRNLELVSVRMPVLATYTNLFTGFINRGYIDAGGNAVALGNNQNMLSDFIEVKFNSVAFRRFKKDGTPVNSFGEFAFYDKNKNFISRRISMDKVDESITLPNNTRYIRIWSKPVDKDDGGWDELAMLIYSNEAPSQIKNYLDNKTNILNTSKDVVLRGIGNVKDELDCLTGEVTERIGEIVLDGSENWRNTTTTGAVRFSISLENLTTGNKRSPIISDYFPYASSGHKYPSSFVYDGLLYVYLEKTTTLEELKTWLGINKPSVQYQLATDSIKTVDLSIHDKDHQKVERLTSFEGGTYFTTTSQDGSLLPTLTVDVVTDLEETLMVCSLEGNTI